VQFILYGHDECSLCDRLEELIQPHLVRMQQAGTDCQLLKRNIRENEHWLTLYRTRVPVLIVDGSEILEGNPTPEQVDRALADLEQ